MKKQPLLIIIVTCIIISIFGFTFLIVQQERILRKYFIIDPQERMKAYKASLSNSLAKYFIRENKSSTVDQVIDYIRRYGRTSLFDFIFLFKDKDDRIRQISNIGMTSVVSAVLTGENVYPTAIDNGKIDGYLVVMLKETGEAELKEGLQKYNLISYSIRFMFLLLLTAFSIIIFYHLYSAKMKLAIRIAEMKASNDGLTGLYTHEYFMKVLNIEVDKFRIYHTPIALLILDIDNFKRLNDNFGHVKGDDVLADVAKIIKFSTRATDILSRYGGEEFALIVPYVEKGGKARDRANLKEFITGVKELAERIRQNVEDYKSEFLPEDTRVTISIGGSFYYHRTDSITGTNLLQRADMVLYRAKRLGRNRVCFDYESALPY